MKFTLAILLVTASYCAYLAQELILARFSLAFFLVLVVASLAGKLVEGRRV